MKKQRITVEMPLLPSERSGVRAIWETKKVLAIIDKRKKKAAKKAQARKTRELSIKKTASLRAMSYKEYLRSKYWKGVKLVVLKKYKYSCQECGSNSSLQVHHKEYVPRGTEHNDLTCLTLLCGSCHQEKHGLTEGIYAPWGGRVGIP